jgi:siroheme synthase-like protein
MTVDLQGPDRVARAPAYPVSLHLQGRPCVVVGGGRVGERKVRGLLRSGARVTVVAPSASAHLEGLAAEGRIAWRRRGYRPGDLDGAWLAFAATDSAGVNADVAAEAHQRGVLLNVAGGRMEADFDLPAVLARGRLQVAVSTQGASPGYARRVRDEIGNVLTEAEADVVDYLDGVRRRAMAHFKERPEAREAFWRSLFEGELVGLLRRGDWSRAEEIVRRCLSSP